MSAFLFLISFLRLLDFAIQKWIAFKGRDRRRRRRRTTVTYCNINQRRRRRRRWLTAAAVVADGPTAALQWYIERILN